MGQKLENLYSAILFFRYFTNHLLESIHIWTIGTINGCLSLDSFKHLGSCPRAGLEVKSRTS